MIDLVKYPVSTEKSYRLIEKNQYTFDVDVRLTKPQIRKVFENLFDIKVLAVNTHLLPTKKKRLGLNLGFKTRYKRAIITIKANQTIPIFENSDS
jgi:large subunit ribosomal protein L23|uniref:Large ribosomal subunit protein uL23c n=1 Tax=Tupiella akineta TaxID=160070 RepID=RK23_TUPAK|nr:ribosomal protein L23 [Tupiella akineta]Q3ZJ88.1 RecName: Full=Large ribosomal subunit protein uL23c; AltName: Full=50S ribosomal protein L23, chloroplastic [Tupiella akineta]AAV80603.1 ribosomal protein L23 [Tupiella akineta]